MKVAVKRVTKKTKYSALTDLLREEIISGRLLPGSRITVAEVALRYGISQMPVREALKQLAGEGLIIFLPRKGARVVPINVDFVNHVYDLRGAIESLLVRLCVPHINNATMNKLDDLCRQSELAAEAGDVKRLLSINREFHDSLNRLSGNPVALELYDRYTKLMGRLRQKYGVRPNRVSEIAKGHATLVQALREQDADRLGNLVILQCELAKNDLISLMDDERKSQPENSLDATTAMLVQNSAGK